MTTDGVDRRIPSKLEEQLTLVQKYGVPLVFSVGLLLWTLYEANYVRTDLMVSIKALTSSQQELTQANARLADQLAQLRADLARPGVAR